MVCSRGVLAKTSLMTAHPRAKPRRCAQLSELYPAWLKGSKYFRNISDPPVSHTARSVMVLPCQIMKCGEAGN
jgi:hypothetical protein